MENIVREKRKRREAKVLVRMSREIKKIKRTGNVCGKLMEKMKSRF